MNQTLDIGPQAFKRAIIGENVKKTNWLFKTAGKFKTSPLHDDDDDDDDDDNNKHKNTIKIILTIFSFIKYPDVYRYI